MRPFKELVRTMFHPGPIATMVLITTITLSVIYCSLMWWPPQQSLLGLLILSSFLTFSGLTMYNFFSAMLFGPGFLHREWRPCDLNENQARSKLQFCAICSGFKAPRSHHCRQCGRCVIKMDHHCPWINCCVGHVNHASFVGFLVSAAIGCSEATIILSFSLYHAVYRSYYIYYDIEAPLVYLGLYGFIWCLFSLGCAFGVAFGVSLLLYYQVKIIWRNRTSIEDWIVEKAEYRRSRNTDLPPFIYPYDLGWKRNLGQVINLTFQTVGDGIVWPIVDGCDQYSLTVEQIDQKNEKRERTKEYTIVETFNGSWCAWRQGCCVLFHPPCSDESRIVLNKDDRVLVSRWKRYWLYGERISHPYNSSNDQICKGWFPRRCAIEVINPLPQHFAQCGDTCDGRTSENKASNHKLNSKKLK